MLTILGHKGNANQNYTEIPLHHSQNGDTVTQTKNFGKNVVKRRNTSTLLVEM
jgi:hypothetical protein